MEVNWEKEFDENFPLPENDNFTLLGDDVNAIDLIEEYLMKDDVDDGNTPTSVSGSGSGCGDDLLWLDDLLLDFPLDAHAQAQAEAQAQAQAQAQEQTQAQSGDVNSNDMPNFDNDKSSEDDQVLESNDTDDDPLSKKRKRQLRNRDAAMRSRERKKVYVKDLETKSRYLEAECRRLGRLLQCCYAENQMLRISLGSAYGASMAKSESAVLLLESLLLVSLVWLMVNICLPKLPLLNQDAVPHASVVERREQESAAPNKKGTEVTELCVTLSFMKSKRCRASRIKMKSDFDCAILCFFQLQLSWVLFGESWFTALSFE